MGQFMVFRCTDVEVIHCTVTSAYESRVCVAKSSPLLSLPSLESWDSAVEHVGLGLVQPKVQVRTIGFSSHYASLSSFPKWAN